MYNTTGLTGINLSQAEAKANSQEVLIAKVFQGNPGAAISPNQMHAFISRYWYIEWPLTSIRRAITNLTDAGVLVKLPKQVTGAYGMPEHCWKLKPKNPVQSKLF